MARAHQVALFLDRGVWLNTGECVMHTCDMGWCQNPRHLVIGTLLDNNVDMVNKGRQRAPLGEEHGCAKLTAAQVTAIRAACQAGETQAALAKRFATPYGTINSIVKRRTWKHL
jgi:hypothetical protein